jgi:hypothetical protein
MITKLGEKKEKKENPCLEIGHKRTTKIATFFLWTSPLPLII